ncbi:MAG TPA: FkbM family methyltransferase [Puia sp.]|nr:FkbM family methyltransferase [Puia sp.]
MIHRIKKYVKHLIAPDLRYKIHRIPHPLKKLGTAYGGWTIPTTLLGKDSVCYLAGAGVDISFDAALARRIGCPVWIFDPTPRAQQHFDQLIKAAANHKTFYVYPDTPYDIDPASASLLHFIPIGLWNHADTVKFFAPKNDTHVSHSISNLQDTDHYFEAKVQRLSDIMQTRGHQRLDLLKLDIEGAEFEVLDTILEDGIDITILCVEFHPEKDGSKARIQAALDKLVDHGFRIIARDEMDFTFLKTAP